MEVCNTIQNDTNLLSPCLWACANHHSIWKYPVSVVHTNLRTLWIKTKSALESGFKKMRFRWADSLVLCGGRSIRIKTYAVSKISGFMWTGPWKSHKDQCSRLIPSTCKCSIILTGNFSENNNTVQVEVLYLTHPVLYNCRSLKTCSISGLYSGIGINNKNFVKSYWPQFLGQVSRTAQLSYISRPCHYF